MSNPTASEYVTSLTASSSGTGMLRIAIHQLWR